MQILLDINKHRVDTISDIFTLADMPIILKWDYFLDYIEFDSETQLLVDKPRQQSFFIEIFQDEVIEPILSVYRETESTYYIYSNRNLPRGFLYSGYIEIVLQDGTTASLNFSFLYNDFPIIENVVILPENPTIDDNLSFSYDMESDVDGIIVKSIWYKNGIRQSFLDDISVIDSRYLTAGDSWFVEILSFDGYSYGEKQTSPTVDIDSNKYIISDSLYIYPLLPNINDILEARFATVSGTRIERENIAIIRWFLNGQEVLEYQNNFFFRYDFEVGDEVWFEIKLKQDNEYIASSIAIFSNPDPVIFDILINGLKTPQHVSNTSVRCSWNSTSYDASQLILKVGKYFGDDSVYSISLPPDTIDYTIPSNVLMPGHNYFISLGFLLNNIWRYFYTEFKTSGNAWLSVDNSIGWTIECLYILENNNEDMESLSQNIIISDGKYFAEIKLSNGKISLISSEKVDSAHIDTQKSILLTIAGKNNDIKIYVNRDLVVDGTGLFNIQTNDRFIEIGDIEKTGLPIRYKYIKYTVDNAYFVEENLDIYSEYTFYPVFRFNDREIVSLHGYSDNYNFSKIISTNPRDENEYPIFYLINSDSIRLLKAFNRYNYPISNISKSNDGTRVAFAANSAVYLFSNYIIPFFDINMDFASSGLPVLSDWDVLKNTDKVVSSIVDGNLNINTISEIDTEIDLSSGEIDESGS